MGCGNTKVELEEVKNPKIINRNDPDPGKRTS